jgi:hypothetical protein
MQVVVGFGVIIAGGGRVWGDHPAGLPDWDPQ